MCGCVWQQREKLEIVKDWGKMCKGVWGRNERGIRRGGVCARGEMKKECMLRHQARMKGQTEEGRM